MLWKIQLLLTPNLIMFDVQKLYTENYQANYEDLLK